MIDRTPLLALVSTLFLAVLSAAEPPAARSSISAAIRAGLPKYDPRLAREPDPAAAATEGAILLPRLIVRDTKPPPSPSGRFTRGQVSMHSSCGGIPV